MGLIDTIISLICQSQKHTNEEIFKGFWDYSEYHRFVVKQHELWAITEKYRSLIRRLA
jgi:hypothetical protein